MKKQFFEDIKGLFLFLLPYIITILAIAACYFVAYKIAVSDLPAWFKFFLLQRG